ncbi:MAG: hypothetical protein KAV87_42970 [Desulfobacteraceae bacterium]|nr:hypothetical protein [Desulfobacteraceae bacterium]
MKRNEAVIKKKLLSEMPYSKDQLKEFDIRELKMLASIMCLDVGARKRTI